MNSETVFGLSLPDFKFGKKQAPIKDSNQKVHAKSAKKSQSPQFILLSGFKIGVFLR